MPAFFCGALAGCEPASAPPATAELVIEGHRVIVELAIDADDQERGLKNRDYLEDGRGMLFVLHKPADVCMWMQDTRLPLSVAFLDERGAIINIADMEPQTEMQHCSDKPASFALEVSRGWFASRHIRPGATVHGTARARP